MSKVFRSSFWELFKRFILVLLLLVAIVVAATATAYYFMKFDIKKVLDIVVLAVSGVIVILLAILLSFVAKRSSVVVDEETVNIIKGNSVYKSFPKEGNEFKYNVHRSMGLFIHRSLRVIETKKNKWKDYRLYFSRKRFEKLIDYIKESKGSSIAQTNED